MIYMIIVKWKFNDKKEMNTEVVMPQNLTEFTKGRNFGRKDPILTPEKYNQCHMGITIS